MGPAVKRFGKFNAKRTNGYASALEARHADKLQALTKARDPKERVVRWKEQSRIPFLVGDPPKLVCTYVCDFEVEFADGRTEFHEVKGFETPEWKLKKKLFEALYPDRKLVVITK